MTEREGGSGAVVPNEVLELLEERSRIQGWMERLTELRTDATPAVYEKVRADYEQRLQGVSGRLAEHRSDLESSVARHRSRVETLEEQRDQAATRLEEAELRYRVGEFGEDEWARYREKGEAETRELEERLGEEQEALATLESVLGDLVAGGSVIGDRDGAADDTEGGEGRGVDQRPGNGSEAETSGGTASGEETGPTLQKTWGSGERGLRPSEGSSPETTPAGATSEAAPSVGPGEQTDAVEDASEEYLDELEFLESLSLDETERFDAVSAMLEEETSEESGEGSGPKEEERSP